MPKELTLNKKNVKYLAMLIVLLLGILVVDTIGKADGKKAGQAAKESMTALFSIDFRRDIAAQLPPCTKTGREFWTLHLGTIRDAFKAKGTTVQSVKAERNGAPEPYSGIGGEGQIVPVRLTITTLDKRSQAETAVSEIRILMIKGENDQWLLDGLVPDLPASASK